MKKQKEFILEYITEEGSITPARMIGKLYKANDGETYMFPSELGKRCREMRAAGILDSEPDKDNPKFERFFRKQTLPQQIKEDLLEPYFPKVLKQVDSLFSWKSDNNNHPLQ